MQGREVAKKLSTAYKETNPNNCISLFNELCDEFNIPYFAKYTRGRVTTVENQKIEVGMSNLIKTIEKRLQGTIELQNFYDELPAILLVHIDNDDEKLKKALDKDKNIEIIFIVKTIKDPKVIIDLLIGELNRGKFDINDLVVLENVNDDELIEKLFSEIKYEKFKSKIVKYFKSDDFKLKYWDYVLDNDFIATVASINSDELKLEKSKELDEEEYSIILETLKSDELKLKCMKKGDISAIKSLESDNKKIKWIKDNKSSLTEEIIYELIVSIKNDIKKVECIDLLSNKQMKINLLDKAVNLPLDILKNECKKLNINLLEKIEEFNKGKFVGNLEQKWKKIGLPNEMTFGIEIETTGKNFFLFTVFQKLAKRWDIKNEASTNEEIKLIEISSPILKDNNSDILEVYKVNEFLNELGAKVYDDCGGHIHIGANYLSTLESYQRLIEIWCNCEKIFCEIANEAGENLRNRAEFFAMPISAMFENKEIDKKQDITKEDFIKYLKKEQCDRDSAINFFNVDTNKNTIEFRIPNGTINPDVWIENVRLFGRLVQVSEELGRIDNKPKEKLTNEDRRKLWLSTMLIKKEVSEEDKCKFLINLLFEEEEYKKVYFDRYNKNRQQILFENKFGLLDFKNLYRELTQPEHLKKEKGAKENGTKDENSFSRG